MLAKEVSRALPGKRSARLPWKQHRRLFCDSSGSASAFAILNLVRDTPAFVWVLNRVHLTFLVESELSRLLGAMVRMVQRKQTSVTQSVRVVSVFEGEDGVTRLKSVLESAPRPFVLVSERELSVLRRGLTKDGWKRGLYLRPSTGAECLYVGAGLQSVANQSLERDLDLSLPSQNEAVTRSVLSLALAHSIEKDRAYADKAAQILLDCACGGGLSEPDSPGVPCELGTSARLWIALAQAYDLIYYSRSLSDEQREYLETELLRPAALRLMDEGISGSDAAWNTSAVGVIGLSLKDEVLVHYALNAFVSLIAERLGVDGLWPDSISDHFSSLSALVHLAEGCYRAGIDLYGWQGVGGRSFRTMFSAPLQLAYPSFRLPAIGGGWHDAFLPVHLYEIAFRRWDDQAFAWVLKRAYKFGDVPANADQRAHLDGFVRTSFYAFLFGRDLPGRVRPMLLRSTDMPSLGLCTLRSGEDTMVTLHYGPSHNRHLDRLSFTFYGGDQLLIPDYRNAGCSPALADWSQETAAHNCVIVDGLSQETACECRLVSRYRGTLLQYAEAVALNHYPGVSQTRRVVLVGETCFVDDQLSSQAEHDYDWLARCEGSLATRPAGTGVDFDASRHPLVDIDHASLVEGSARVDYECETARLTLALWTHGAPATAALGTSQVDASQRRVPVFLCRTHGLEARFTALLTVAREPVELGSEAGVFTVAAEHHVDHVFLAGGDTGTGSLKTDGQVAAVRTSDGEVIAVALIGGSWVSWMGETLLQCPATVDCVEVYFGERYPTINYCSDTAGVLRLRTRARAMRLNGHRTAAAATDGHALLRVMPQMLGPESLELKS